MMEKMRIKPAQIKECCEMEDKHHKAKIVCLSLFMFGVASTYGSYFDDLVFRSGMWQQQMLAGNVDRIDFIDKLVGSDLPGDGFYSATGDWHASQLYADETWEGNERRKWENWSKMHNDNVIWFDTSACLDARHIAGVNRPNGSPDAYKVDTWKATYASLAITNDYDYDDIDLYRDFRRAWFEMIEDCDVDCQARGSQLTVVGGLMGLLYFFVQLNALFMFIGTWRYRWRICSVYCTFFVCLFQLCVLIAAGAMLFTRYNGVCSRSMRTTSVWDGAWLWTMADDFYTTRSIWVMSFFTMFGFLCCSHQQIEGLRKGGMM